MRVVIIEDESPAAEKLQKALTAANDSITILAVLKSVKAAIEWFGRNPAPDLVLMDIELTDGLSFKIFDEVTIGCPIIFTTAYDQYWQEAFEFNSIDYLLKPVKQEKLEQALQKYTSLKSYFSQDFQKILQPATANGYKKRFLVKRGADYVSIKSEDIAYFYASHKVVCLVDNSSNKYILDQSLADLESQLDPAQFYRVNRKYLLHINSIKKIKSYPKSKILLELVPAVQEEIIISQENVSAFKSWMEQ